MAAEQQPAASWGADTDGRLNQPSEHLTHHAMWQTDASGNVTGLVGPDGKQFNPVGIRNSPLKVAIFGDSTANFSTPSSL